MADYAPGGKPVWCECLHDKGKVVPAISKRDIVHFVDEFQMIDTNIYDENHSWKEIKREFVISEKEYMKRKLANR